MENKKEFILKNGYLVGNKCWSNPLTIVCGPCGSGKTRCIIKPNILNQDYDGSMIILNDAHSSMYNDLKSELEDQGYLVLKMDLFDKNSSIKVNPIELYKDNVDQLVELMFHYSEAHIDVEWSEHTKPLLKSAILHVLKTEKKNLRELKKIITMNSRDMFLLLKESPSEACRNTFSELIEYIGADNIRMFNSLVATMFEVISSFLKDEILEVTDETTFSPLMLLAGVPEEMSERVGKNLKNINSDKIALFYSKTRYHRINQIFEGMFLELMYDGMESYKRANTDNTSIRVFINDFEGCSRFKDFFHKTLVCTGYDMSFIIECQDYKGISSKYGEKVSSGIVANSGLQIVHKFCNDYTKYFACYKCDEEIEDDGFEVVSNLYGYEYIRK